MRSIIKHIVIMLILLSNSVVWAQTKVEVITKTVEKSFTPKKGYTIRIDGESAKINVKGWEQKNVRVVLKLISKGMTKTVAERELAYQQYAIDDLDESHVIRNYLLVPQELKELSSIQETEINIWVPGAVDLSIENKFGEIAIDGHKGDIGIDSEYGDILLNNTSGKMSVVSDFGDLSVLSAKGKLSFDLEHTETFIEAFDGDAIINSNLGDVSIAGMNPPSTLLLDADKSDVKISVSSVNDFRWSIRSKYGNFKGPDEFTTQQRNTKNISLDFGNSSLPLIKINADFGKIEVIDL